MTDMGVALLDISMSLDGFIAQPDDDPGPIHHWLFEGEMASPHNEAFKTSPESSPILGELFEQTGALVVGRRTYDLTRGWGGNHPIAGVPIIVVTHRGPASVPEGSTPFTFATEGVADAVEQARAVAAGKNVVVMGGARIARASLADGLLDEVQIHLAPVLLGEGVRLFEDAGASQIDLEPIDVVDAPEVTHLRYRVVK
jgi:dihydrofolate reductase